MINDPDFIEAWEKTDRQYGDDELENVHLGWEMAKEAQRKAEAYVPHLMTDHPATDRCLRCKKTREEAPGGCEADL